MNWKNIFKKKKEESKFSIEYYPLSKKYYPKYGNWYMGVNPFTGIIELKDYIGYGDYSDTEEGAQKTINKFKEQRFKNGVNVINVD